MREEREREWESVGHKRRQGGLGFGGSWGGEYITGLANVPSCQGVNLSEAVQCDTIYSEIPNLSALIFQPQQCLSQCARDDWSIYKTAATNLLNIYVQERSRIYSSMLCSYAQALSKKIKFCLCTECEKWATANEHGGFEPSAFYAHWKIKGWNWVKLRLL